MNATSLVFDNHCSGLNGLCNTMYLHSKAAEGRKDTGDRRRMQ